MSPVLRIRWLKSWSFSFSISPSNEYSGLISGLTLTRPELEKTLMLGKTEGRRSRRWQRIRWLDAITNSMDMKLSNSRRWWRTEEPGMLQSVGVAESDTT